MQNAALEVILLQNLTINKFSLSRVPCFAECTARMPNGPHQVLGQTQVLKTRQSPQKYNLGMSLLQPLYGLY